MKPVIRAVAMSRSSDSWTVQPIIFIQSLNFGVDSNLEVVLNSLEDQDSETCNRNNTNDVHFAEDVCLRSQITPGDLHELRTTLVGVVDGSQGKKQRYHYQQLYDSYFQNAS